MSVVALIALGVAIGVVASLTPRPRGGPTSRRFKSGA